MNHLAAIFSLSGNGPYLSASFGLVLVVMVANVVLPLLNGRRLKTQIRREIALRRNRSP